MFKNLCLFSLILGMCMAINMPTDVMAKTMSQHHIEANIDARIVTPLFGRTKIDHKRMMLSCDSEYRVKNPIYYVRVYSRDMEWKQGDVGKTGYLDHPGFGQYYEFPIAVNFDKRKSALVSLKLNFTADAKGKVYRIGFIKDGKQVKYRYFKGKTEYFRLWK
ncbi:MAG: hypothetical protein HRT90_12215 [Candidatus Margulisbacteria bacterium]|nr:hypothetical protein [Candidatus Margulisiibacteriota bacterium]